MIDFEGYLRERKVEHSRISTMVTSAKEFEGYLANYGKKVVDCDQEMLEGYLTELIREGNNSPERLVAMARYCAFRNRADLFIYLATMLNSYDILPLMVKRVGELLGEEKREAIFHGFVRPPLGTGPEEYPPLTRRIVQRMEGELTPEQCRTVMTWNYHEIPREAFRGKKERYEASSSLEEFLASEHKTLVEELQECLRTGKVWYEQEVTQEFVDHVSSDQRVQTGVRDEGRIVCEKVPFDTKRYYGEENARLRRYYYCHCPLVRSAIRDGKPLPSSTFCHCSAGFTKTAWDVIFDEEVEIEILETVLGGGEKCVFSIRIP